MDKQTRISFSAYELYVLDLALRGYLEGIDGDYTTEHVVMDALRERLRLALRRVKEGDNNGKKIAG